MKQCSCSPLLWEYNYPRIVCSHNGAADTGEHSASVPRHPADSTLFDCHWQSARYDKHGAYSPEGINLHVTNKVLKSVPILTGVATRLHQEGPRTDT